MSSPQPQNDTGLGINFNPSDAPAVATEAHEASVRETNASHLSNHGDVFDVGKAFTSTHGETGTIVTDRKHLRPSIGDSFKDAFSEWWRKTERNVTRTTEALKKYNEREPEVARAETRAETVKEAVKESQLAPRDDHRIVIEKIRTLQSDTVRVTGAPSITIKEPVKAPAKGSWTYTSETPETAVAPKSHPPRPAGGIPDLRQSTIAPRVEQRIKKSIASYTPQKQTPPPSQSDRGMVKKSPVQVGYMSIPDTVPQKKETPHESVIGVRESVFEGKAIASAPQTISTPVRETPPPVPDLEPVYEVRTVVPTSEPVEPEQQEEVFETPPHEYEPRDAEDVSVPPVFHGVSALPNATEPTEPFDSKAPGADVSRPRLELSQTTWMMLGGAVVVGIILAIGASVSVMLFRGETGDGAQETLTIPAFFKTEEQLSIALESDPVSFLTALKNEVAHSSHASVQLYPVVMGDPVSHVATAEELFAFLGTRLSEETIRALEPALMIGGVAMNEKVPFIVIRSYNFDALFVGLLTWEKYMFADLTPLFTSSSPITSMFFRDTIVNNKPARVLYDDVGNEVVVYSFVNQDTVVITAGSGALTEIIERF